MNAEEFTQEAQSSLSRVLGLLEVWDAVAAVGSMAHGGYW